MPDLTFYSGLCAGIFLAIIPAIFVLIGFETKFRKLAKQFETMTHASVSMTSEFNAVVAEKDAEIDTLKTKIVELECVSSTPIH